MNPIELGLVTERAASERDEFLLLSDFDFDLPPELIAQEPLPQRDGSRLLHVDVARGSLSHHRVSRLPELLHPGDLVVANDSRVFPARLQGATGSGTAVEVLLLRPLETDLWEVLARPSRRLRKGTEVAFENGSLRARVVACAGGGRRTVALFHSVDLFEVLERIGRTPLPPYIKRAGRSLEGSDRERYQTIYARERGSIAAPTAGLHFTRRLLRSLDDGGVGFVTLTLHVGYGTFQPIRTEPVEAHRMEAEHYHIPGDTVQAIEDARARQGRIVAVGTTTVRALESAAQGPGRVREGPGVADVFIYPGFRFQAVDALLTNFHLPRSSLFVLVSAFAGRDLIRRAYEEAIRERYRFYSYGDCMLIAS